MAKFKKFVLAKAINYKTYMHVLSKLAHGVYVTDAYVQNKKLYVQLSSGVRIVTQNKLV